METKPPEKKGILRKIKENVDDHDEQMQILGAMVRLGVVIWSGFIITLNYVELPMVKKTGASSDITFVASIFTGALATFGLSTGNKKSKRQTKTMKIVKPPTGFWLETQLTPDMMRYLWSQINKATINAKNRLVGHITSSLSVPDTEGIFTPYILNQCHHQKLTDKTVLSMNMWVNFQRKYEFNPLHKHSGLLSFVIWMKIPYNFEDEKTAR